MLIHISYYKLLHLVCFLARIKLFGHFVWSLFVNEQNFRYLGRKE